MVDTWPTARKQHFLRQPNGARRRIEGRASSGPTASASPSASTTTTASAPYGHTRPALPGGRAGCGFAHLGSSQRFRKTPSPRRRTPASPRPSPWRIPEGRLQSNSWCRPTERDMTAHNTNMPGSFPSGETAIGDNPITEGALDQVIEDSFPASDVPSHTPLTSLGAPQPSTDDEPPKRYWLGRPFVVGAGAAFALALAIVAAIVWKRMS